MEKEQRHDKDAKTATGGRSASLAGYESVLYWCTATDHFPLSVGRHPKTGEPVTVGVFLRAAFGVELPPLTMGEARELAYKTIYSTRTIYDAFL